MAQHPQYVDAIASDMGLEGPNGKPTPSPKKNLLTEDEGSTLVDAERNKTYVTCVLRVL